MESMAIKSRADKVLVGNYGRYPVAFVRGEGALLWDENDKQYVDFLAGIAVCALGHSHPRVVEAIQNQAKDLIHVSNLYYTEAQTQLAELLVAESFGDKVFFCNSGAEANEAAIKLARIHAPEGCGTIVSLAGSFHGRTLATVAATGQEKFGQGFEPIPGGFRTAPFGDLEALEACIDETVCAIICEPLQGEGGVRPLDLEYLQGIREICDRHQISLIFDEVQTGVGRSAALFAYQKCGVEPDIMTLAKGLASGMPIGAVVARDEIAASLVPGSHGSTFGGNPVCCAAGIATVETILEPGFLAQVQARADQLADGFYQLIGRFPHLFTAERGLGLLRGLVLSQEMREQGSHIVSEMLKHGYLINFAGGVALRFAPPLIVSEEQCAGMLAALTEVAESL